MRASRGLKWENKMYKLKRSIKLESWHMSTNTRSYIVLHGERMFRRHFTYFLDFHVHAIIFPDISKMVWFSRNMRTALPF